MHRGSWKSSSSPRIVGVQWSSTVGSTLWGMASGVAVVLATPDAMPHSAWQQQLSTAPPPRFGGEDDEIKDHPVHVTAPP